MGVVIGLRSYCNVDVPPNGCFTAGSALMFSSDVRNLRGVLTFYPVSYNTNLYDLIDAQVQVLGRVPRALRSCASDQDDAPALHLTELAQCVYQTFVGPEHRIEHDNYPTGVPRSTGPRSLLVARGDAGSYFRVGMHYRTIEEIRRRAQGVTVRLFVMVQP